MFAYLAKRNMTGVELYQEFEYRMFDMLKKMGKDVVTWDSTFNTGMTMPSNSIVHDYEGGNQSVAKIAKAGVKVAACPPPFVDLPLHSTAFRRRSSPFVDISMPFAHL